MCPFTHDAFDDLPGGIANIERKTLDERLLVNHRMTLVDHSVEPVVEFDKGRRLVLGLKELLAKRVETLRMVAYGSAVRIRRSQV